MNDVDAVLLSQGDEFFKKVEIYTLSGRVARETQNHEFGFGGRFRHGSFEFAEEIDAGAHADAADVGTGDDGTVNMNRVARIRNEDRVAAVAGCEHQVSDTFLGADRNDGFFVRINIDVPASLVPIADGLAKTRDTTGSGIAVGSGALRHFDHLVDDVLRCVAVGIAHAQINDVLSAMTGRHLQFVGNVKDVRRESFNAGKIVIHVDLHLFVISNLLSLIETFRFKDESNSFCWTFCQ